MTEEFYGTKREKELYRICWDIYLKLLKKIKFETNEKVLGGGYGNGELSKYLKIKNNLYRIKSSLFKALRKRYGSRLSINKNFINAKSLKNLAKKKKLNLKIIYVFNKGAFIRNLFGNWLARGVVKVDKLK